MGKSINWSYLADAIGDLYDDLEYKPVRVRLPDGRVFVAVDFDTEELELLVEPKVR